MIINENNINITGRIARIATLKEEWYEDVLDPESVVLQIKSSNLNADIFSFMQRLPESKPRFGYYMEWLSIAAIPISSYSDWLTDVIDCKERNLVRKAQRCNVEIRPVSFNDEFVKGMTSIFNEIPIRQGRPFLHYGKSFTDTKKEFSQNLHREDIIGAYYNDELIGFIMLSHADRYTMLTQIISKVRHRDKSTNNLLIAKAIEICASKNIRYLVYALWPKGAIADFKKNNGFERIILPKYFIPTSNWGKLIMRLGLHKNLDQLLPTKLVFFLMQLRKYWYTKKYSIDESK